MKALIFAIAALTVTNQARAARHMALPSWVELVSEQTDGCGLVSLVSPTHIVIEDVQMAVTSETRRGSRQACSYILDLMVEEGWSYKIDGILVRAYADAWNGQASFAFSQYFQGDDSAYVVEKSLSEGTSRYVYQSLNDAPFKPCGIDRALVSKASLRVPYSRTDYAEASLGEAIHLFLSWKRCS